MLDNVAIQCGIFTTLVTTLFTGLMWVFSSVLKLKVEKVGIFFKQVYQQKVKGTIISFGALPAGSFLSHKEDDGPISGLEGTELNRRPLAERLLVLIVPPVLLFIIGLVIFLVASPIGLPETVDIYVKTSLFLITIEEGHSLWNVLFTSPITLLGFVFFFMGVSNIFINLQGLFSKITEGKIWLAFLVQCISFLILIGVFRVTYHYFSVINVVYYVVASLVVGLFSFVLFVLMGRVLS